MCDVQNVSSGANKAPIKIGIWTQSSLRRLDTIRINNSILHLGPRSKVSPGVKKIIDQPVLYVTVSPCCDAKLDRQLDTLTERGAF